MSREQVLRQYIGNDVTCNICGAHFREFKAFGLKKRKNAQCLSCSSLERHRLIWNFLKDFTEFFSNRTIRLLHFAPEKFFYERFSKQRNIEYTPCDLFPELFHFKSMPVPVLKVDITNIPFEDSVFDVILCNHVLEHIPDDLNAMAELYRVLKSGGWGIFQVPLDNRNNSTYEDFSITTPEARQKAFGQKDHVRIYGKDYPDRLRKVGFDVKTNDFALKMSAEERFEYGLKKQLIYYCEKN